MKLLLLLLFLTTPVYAVESKECEKYLEIELSQSRFSLDPLEHLKDGMNKVTFLLPVSCKFYSEVNIGDQLLKHRFRSGSFIVSGSMGKWSLKVKQKYERSPR